MSYRRASWDQYCKRWYLQQVIMITESIVLCCWLRFSVCCFQIMLFRSFSTMRSFYDDAPLHAELKYLGHGLGCWFFVMPDWSLAILLSIRWKDFRNAPLLLVHLHTSSTFQRTVEVIKGLPWGEALPVKATTRAFLLQV